MEENLEVENQRLKAIINKLKNAVGNLTVQLSEAEVDRDAFYNVLQQQKEGEKDA